MKTKIIFYHISLISSRMRNASDKNCRENQNTRFIFNHFFFRNSFRLLENVETYDNMAHAHCKLDTQGYGYVHSCCVILIAFP